MNIPNILTLFRIILIPIFILLFYSSIPYGVYYAVTVFFIAGLTDILDGYIARKYKMITKVGIVLDPLADKLMLITVMTCFVTSYYIPFWILVVIVIQEVGMILAGLVLYKKNVVIPSNKVGKLATFLFDISILILVFNRELGTYLIYFSILIAVVSLITYIYKFFNDKNSNKTSV